MKNNDPAIKWIDQKRALAQSPAAAYISKLGQGSRRTVQQSLARLAALIAEDGADPIKLRWEQLRRPDTIQLRIELKDQFAPATANKMLSVLRGVLRACRNMGLMNEADFQAAASLESIKASKPDVGISVTPAILKKLFAGCVNAGGAAGRRDAALLSIFLSSGLRRSELAALDLADYNSRTGQLHIRGERPEYDRIVTLPRTARRAVKDWLEIRSNEPGPLILPVDRGGLVRFRRMTDQAIYDIFGRITKRANLKQLTTRDLRRAYVVSLIRAGHEIESVRYLVGHASWFTTATYQKLANDPDNKGYRLESLPYQQFGK